MKKQTKPTLLYVEDDLETVRNIVFLLGEYFSKIYTAIDGKEGLEKFQVNRPDIILLDMNIPKINGLELAKLIRKDDNKTPILFLTAYCDKDKLMSAINLGTSSYIVKPLKIDELQSAITKIISKTMFNQKRLACGFDWNVEMNTLIYKAQEMKLTKKEVELINILDKNRTKFFTACELSVDVFQENPKDAKCNNIVQLISRFKNKVVEHFETEEFFIKNIYGIGYKITD
ncbi:MAG: response regulator transcription factor [Sulfurimonas sp.]|nr:response regulator transcription factor [Sulfurimonas sp.]